MKLFQEFKLLIVEHTDLAKDALHIYVALIVFLLACRVMRWPASSWKPWLVVLFAALMGEIWDIQDSLSKDYPIRLELNWKDVWNTMMVPTVLMLAARYTSIFDRKSEPERDGETF